MDVKGAYDKWAGIYDTNRNKTRDLEAIALRETLANMRFEICLEIGCGTGKNTAWLMDRVTQLTAVDLSEEMLNKARGKFNSDKVRFIQADILNEWTFFQTPFDLVTFSLVLEHIENLENIFRKVSSVTRKNGYVYIGELHPFKQYTGTKARFDSGEGQQIVPCFNHHVSDFTELAASNGLEIVNLHEYFDDANRGSIPRILTILLRKR